MVSKIAATEDVSTTFLILCFFAKVRALFTPATAGFTKSLHHDSQEQLAKQHVEDSHIQTYLHPSRHPQLIKSKKLSSQ